jgi:rsbT co-antagonist protein RsbR
MPETTGSITPPETVTDHLLDVLTNDAAEVAGEWTEAQQQEGVRRSDLFTEEEGHEQTRRFIAALASGLRAAGRASLFEFGGEEWSDLRAVLADVTSDRIERGVTPAEMAMFVLAMKGPVFARLRARLGDDSDALAEEIGFATRLVDAFVLHVIDVFQAGRDAIIRRQQSEMVELSTPVVQLWNGILTLPLIGTLDSMRAQDVMENVLETIVARQAEIVILDITGVKTVDTQVAQHLLRTAAAVRLMGATCVISGISPHIAQTMVQLGVEVGDVVTRSDIQSALVYAFKRLNLVVAPADAAARGLVV